MAVTIPFGKLKLGDFPGRNMPDHDTLVEPFGDGGTIAVQKRRKRSKRHVLNVSDPITFTMFRFVQNLSVSDKTTLKQFDWVSSEETFGEASSNQAEDGPELYWRTMYVKKFGTKETPTDPEAPMVWDPLTAGRDTTRHVLSGLPLMRAKLQKVELLNEENPLSLFGKFDGPGTFWLLTPAKPDELLVSRLGSLRGKFFYAAKAKTGFEVIQMAEQLKPVNVVAHAASSIMMATMIVAYNYEAGRELTPIEPAGAV